MLEKKINVEIRIKPSIENSLEITDTTLVVGTKKYQFHKIHVTTTQKRLYNDSVSSLLDKFLEGYNCTVIAYGQTGSGKTYTMGISQNDTSGIVPQTLEALFAKNIKLICTFIEVYNEDVIDLLADHKVPLSLREIHGDIQIAGVSEVELSSMEDGLEILKRGCMERTTKSTRMNMQSSRSHAIFTLFNRKEVDDSSIISKFSFVDLAGSERLKRTMCIGERAKESISINSGLLSLGNVISALYKKQKHVPFRDSKLTRILQSCLNGHVLMIACISSSNCDLNETHNTLKYANRAASIETTSRLNIEVDNKRMAVILLKKEIQKLRNENQILKERIRKCKNANFEVLEKENRNLKSKLESVEYERAVKENSEDLAQEIVKNPFVQDLINQNEKLKDDVKRLKDELANLSIGNKTLEPNMQMPINGFNFGNVQNKYFEFMINHKDDYNEDKQNIQFKTKQNKKFPAVEDSYSDLDNVVPRKVSPHSTTNINIVSSVACEEIFEKSCKIETAIKEKKENKMSWTAQNRKRVTFDVSPPKKKMSLWTPRKERILLENKTLDTLNGFVPYTMALYNGCLIFASSDNKVRMWDKVVTEMFTDCSIRCIESLEHIYYTTRMILKQFDARTGTSPIYAFKNEISAIKKVGDLIYTGHEDGTLSCVDTRNMKCVSEKVHNGTIFCIESIDDLLYTGSRDHSIKAQKCEIYKSGLVTLSPPHYDSVHGLLNYKGELISISRDCSLKRWKNSTIIKTIQNAHSSWIRCGGVMDGSFVTGSKNGSLRFWDFCDNSIFCVGSYKMSGSVNCIQTNSNELYIGAQNKEIAYIKSEYKV